jgi:hypothetical protein
MFDSHKYDHAVGKYQRGNAEEGKGVIVEGGEVDHFKFILPKFRCL